MASVIAVANMKGGVGKTTTVISLAAALTELGFRVLAVDLDPQTSLTAATLGERVAASLDPAFSSFEAICGSNPVTTPALMTAGEGFSVLPGSYDLVGASQILGDTQQRELRLLDSLAPVQAAFDYILLDCPPGLGLLMINGLAAARWVLIPTSPRYTDMRGLATMIDTIGRVREAFNPRLAILGILSTIVRQRSRHRREVADVLEETFGDLLFETTIPDTVSFWEAPSSLASILHYAPDSPGAIAYRRLAEEVLHRAQA